MGILKGKAGTATAILLVLLSCAPAEGAYPCREVVPEQRHFEVRDPSCLPSVRLPSIAAPPTVSRPQTDTPPRNLSLDEAIRIALANSEVVRVLAGVTAVSSGQTIYDTAASNTGIDEQRARFDPSVLVNNRWDRLEPPQAFEDPLDSTRTVIGGFRTDDHDVNFELSKTNVFGGEMSFGVNSNTSRFRPGVFPLNPRTDSSLDLTVTQPLLQGGNLRANLAPIVVARIDTERSFFQFKDSVQELVRGVVEGYWALVFARTDVWAREQQVEQATFAYNQAEARFRFDLADIAEVAQTRVSLANFRASLIGAQANVLQREAALRNLLGLLPYDGSRVVPITPPTDDRLQVDWRAIINIAEQRRPDLIELKLILEADQQLLLQARNQTLPRLDAVALYRWNGLEGTMPIGDRVSSGLSRATDWTLGVNFSVPLAQRGARAQLRQRELLIARDRANLGQGLHSAIHLLALSIRNLDQFYEQYQAFQETRIAARDNLEAQSVRWNQGIIQYINVLQAIVDWGNSVSAEAQALAQYNTELATLERETGTILETHGIRFLEERYGSVGPLGCFFQDVCYPEAIAPTPNADRYPVSDEPAEEFFGLEDPLEGLSETRQRLREELAPPDPAATPTDP